MLSRTQWVCVAALALVCTGCGDSSTPDDPTTADTEPRDARDAANVTPRRQTPSPSVTLVTFHVKDMGTRLNLL